MCPLLPTFVQESTVRGNGVLVSVSVAHLGMIAHEDPELALRFALFFRVLTSGNSRREVLHILSDLSFTFMASRLSGRRYPA